MTAEDYVDALVEDGRVDVNLEDEVTRGYTHPSKRIQTCSFANTLVHTSRQTCHVVLHEWLWLLQLLL